MKPERRFRQSVTKYINDVYIWPISDSYQAGVPDHYYSGRRADLWCEYKYYPTDRARFDLCKPPRYPKLTVRQQAWLNGRHDEGRLVWVIVGMPSGGVILMNKEWMEPVEVQGLMSRQELAQEIMRVCNATRGN